MLTVIMCVFFNFKNNILKNWYVSTVLKNVLELYLLIVMQNVAAIHLYDQLFLQKMAFEVAI